jgi:hypothetical protein
VTVQIETRLPNHFFGNALLLHTGMQPLHVTFSGSDAEMEEQSVPDGGGIC